MTQCSNYYILAYGVKTRINGERTAGIKRPRERERKKEREKKERGFNFWHICTPI